MNVQAFNKKEHILSIRYTIFIIHTFPRFRGISIFKKSNFKIIEYLPRFCISSWNFICINCIPAFVVERVCLSSCKIKIIKQLSKLQNTKYICERRKEHLYLTFISLCCPSMIISCFIDLLFNSSSETNLLGKHCSFFGCAAFLSSFFMLRQKQKETSDYFQYCITSFFRQWLSYIPMIVQ